MCIDCIQSSVGWHCPCYKKASWWSSWSEPSSFTACTSSRYSLSDNACSSGISFGKAYGYTARVSKEQVWWSRTMFYWNLCVLSPYSSLLLHLSSHFILFGYLTVVFNFQSTKDPNSVHNAWWGEWWRTTRTPAWQVARNTWSGELLYKNWKHMQNFCYLCNLDVFVCICWKSLVLLIRLLANKIFA